MKKNSSHKTLSIVKRISITNIGIFIIACILSIVATSERYGKGFADRVFRSDGAGYSERY